MSSLSFWYHAGCPDGFGAAWAAWCLYGDSEHYHPVTHGEEEPECSSEYVYLLDFSFKAPKLEQLAQRFELYLLDHHKTAVEEVAKIPFLKPWLDQHVVLDMNRSGAVITWEYFHNRSVPLLLQYVQDRDLWSWQMENSEEVLAYVDSFPFDFHEWTRIADEIENNLGGVISIGKSILRMKVQDETRILRNAFVRDVLGYSVPIVNSPIHQSDLCHKLLNKYTDLPFAAAYYDIGSKRRWSLRGRGDFDVSSLAATQAGGGHHNAAGFEESI